MFGLVWHFLGWNVRTVFGAMQKEMNIMSVILAKFTKLLLIGLNFSSLFNQTTQEPAGGDVIGLNEQASSVVS